MSEGSAFSRSADAPWLTRSLVLVNLAMFGVTMALGGSQTLLQSPGAVLVLLGANYAELVAAGHWERLLTSAFLHGSAIHLLFNTVALFQIGPLLEKLLGRARTSMVYVAAAVGGGLASYAGALRDLERAGISIGASGAICGLIGATAVLGYRMQGAKSPLGRAMLRWLLTIVVFGFVIPNIDNHAHIGGAVVGGLAALAFKRGAVYSPLGRALRIAACVAVVLASFLRLFTSDPGTRELWQIRKEDPAGFERALRRGGAPADPTP